MHKRQGLLLTVILLAVLFSSCNSAVPQNNDSEDNLKTKITFLSSWGGIDSKSEALKSVLSEFAEKHPDIEVVDESLFGEDFLPKLKTDFAAGDDPDVFGLWPGSDIKTLINVGKVANLTNYLKDDPKWKSSFGNNMWSFTTYENKIFGLPFEIIFEGMFVNKDLFSKYNLQIPTNFDQLKHVIKVFRKNGITPIAWNATAEGTYLYQNIIANLVPKNDTASFGKSNASRKVYLKALPYLKELYKLGAFPNNSFHITNAERNNLFINKKAAMICQGSWFIGNFNDNDESVDIVPFPKINNSQAEYPSLIYGLGNGTFHLSTSAAANPLKQKAALLLLKELTSKATSEFFTKKTGMIGNISSTTNYKRLSRKGIQIIFNARQHMGPPDSYVDRSAWEEVISEKVPFYLEGNMTAEQLSKEFDSYGGSSK